MRKKGAKPRRRHPFTRLRRFWRRGKSTSMNELTNQARQILKGKRAAEPPKTLFPGVAISWEGVDGKLTGPALIEGIFQLDDQDWVWLTYAGQERLICTKIIVKVHAVPA